MPVLEHHGAVSVVRPAGPVRLDNVEDLHDLVLPGIMSGVPYVVIDLSETPLIDGAGLEWILDMDDECSKRGGCARLCGIGELCSDLLRITAIGDNIEQFDDLASAIASFA